jgi:hypothetical protein
LDRYRRAALLVALLVSAALGAVPAAADDPLGGRWHWPAEGRLTQHFGCTGAKPNGRHDRCAHYHAGIDIANRGATPIRAARAGVVRFVGYNRHDPPGKQAWIVILDHGNGVRSWYAHLKPRVAPGARRGQRVAAGDVIGYMGATGRATGVHLHFAVQHRGKFVDPMPLLGKRDRDDDRQKPRPSPKPRPRSTPRPAPTAEAPRPTTAPEKPREAARPDRPRRTHRPEPTPTLEPTPVASTYVQHVIVRAPLIWLPAAGDTAQPELRPRLGGQ